MQGPIAHKEQPSRRGVHRRDGINQYRLHFLGIQRSDRDARLRAQNREEKMTTIRQEVWVTVPRPLVRFFGHRLWFATRGRNLTQTNADVCKDDHPGSAPRSPFQSVNVAERLRTPARQLNSLQLAL